MSDKEPRKRRKKKEGVKKDEHSEEILLSSRLKHIKEEVSDSDADADDDFGHEPNGVARCVFFVLFSLLVAASGIIYFSLQGSENNLQHEGEELPVEQMHPWAQHEEQQTRKINFDSLYEESEYEDEAGFLDSTSKSDNDEMLRGEVTENGAVEVSIASINENVIEKNDYQSSSQVFAETEPTFENSEVENQILTVSTQTEPEIVLQSSQAIASESFLEKDKDNEDTRWTELQGDSFLSPSDVDQRLLEASVSSRPEETRQADFTPEEESRANPTENVVSPTTEIRHTEASVDGASSSATQDVTCRETTVENTDAPSSEVNGDVPQPEPSADVPYENADITNEYDFIFRDEIDEADQMIQKSPEKALKVFDSLLSKHPRSCRAQYGQARSLDRLAETRRSNALLEQAINAYNAALQQPNIPEALYIRIGERVADRMRFRGFVAKALQLQLEMTKKFPGNANVSNQLAVSYLMAGKGQKAKIVLKQVLDKHPTNGFAKVHYGFILKTEENKNEESIKYLSEGIASREPGVIDGRFFFQLGDALARTKRLEEAMKVYEQGVQEGVFLSVYQRSLYNVKGLTGKPWWRPEETPYYTYTMLLEKNWKTIQKEAVALMNDKKSGFTPESEGLQDTGDWKQFEMFARGQKVVKNCARAPQTCSLLEKIPDATGCKRGQIKFSIMQPGTHIWAHTGPTNCRLRSHLGLVVPKGPRIRVANETREWTEGKVLIFDDSFEHEVWHEGKSFRLVLIVDFWHPELTLAQRKSLTPI